MSAKPVPVALFRLGRIVSTPNALSQVPSEEMLTGISRHQAGDWGEVTENDWHVNGHALATGARILSVYHAENETKF